MRRSSEGRRRIRIFLQTHGFERTASSGDQGDGRYTELWRDSGSGDTVALIWGERAPNEECAECEGFGGWHAAWCSHEVPTVIPPF